MFRKHDPDATERMCRVLRAILERDHPTAERELAEWVRTNSRDPVAYMALAFLYRERGEIGRALQVHQNLLLRGDLQLEDRERVQLALGEDLRAGGFKVRAIAAYRDAFEANPKCGPAHDALIELYAETDEPERALEILKRASGWRRRPDPVRESTLLTALARKQHSQGHHDEARRSARRAVKRDPQAVEPLIVLGELEAERGRPKAALAAWSEAIARAQDDADGLWQRVAALYAGLGRSDEFEGFARGRLASAPGGRAATRALARCLAAGGDADGALLELRGLLDANARDDRTRAELGRLLLAEGRATDALKAYEEWIEVVTPAQDADLASPEDRSS